VTAARRWFGVSRFLLAAPLECGGHAWDVAFLPPLSGLVTILEARFTQGCAALALG
jgi:hypothetical protein